MSFVMMSAGQAGDKLLQLADVIVYETRWSVPVASDLADATLRLLPGCALVAVGLVDGGCLLRCRTGSVLVVRLGSGSTGELFQLAAIAYSALALVASATPGAARRDQPLADHRFVRRFGKPARGVVLPG